MYHDKVRPKKFLGQHFLTDQHIARRIVEGLKGNGASTRVLEIGPGMGVLTQYLLQRSELDLKVIEIDRDSVAYLKQHFPALENRVVEGDFLEIDPAELFVGRFSIIGNFPYNISSQIFFRVLEQRQHVDEVVCMLQKEVADRLASPPGNKTYGILSVLLQAYFNIEFLFKVPPGVFNPPPKVMSGVIRLTRNQTKELACDEKLFVQVVKQGFNNRRKTLRNALKILNLPASVPVEKEEEWKALLDLRAERLTVDDFVRLTRIIQEYRAGTNH